MPEIEEKSLLEGAFNAPPSAKEKRMTNAILTLAKETRSGAWEYALSPRDLVSFVKTYELFCLKKGRGEMSEKMALKVLEGKFEGDEVGNFQCLVESGFRVNLKETRLWGRKP